MAGFQKLAEADSKLQFGSACQVNEECISDCCSTVDSMCRYTSKCKYDHFYQTVYFQMIIEFMIYLVMFAVLYYILSRKKKSLLS